MIEIVILYILTKYDATIYRVCKIINELFFAFLKSSTGTVNPAIKRLEKIGALNCLNKMSEGGMFSKTYSITKAGKDHLVDLLLSFKEENPYHLINEAKILLFCSDVLSVSQMIEFKQNLLNLLELQKIKIEKGLKNEYIDLTPIQKKLSQTALEEISGLIESL